MGLKENDKVLINPHLKRDSFYGGIKYKGILNKNDIHRVHFIFHNEVYLDYDPFPYSEAMLLPLIGQKVKLKPNVVNGIKWKEYYIYTFKDALPIEGCCSNNTVRLSNKYVYPIELLDVVLQKGTFNRTVEKEWAILKDFYISPIKKCISLFISLFKKKEPIVINLKIESKNNINLSLKLSKLVTLINN